MNIIQFQLEFSLEVIEQVEADGDMLKQAQFMVNMDVFTIVMELLQVQQDIKLIRLYQNYFGTVPIIIKNN